MSKNDPERPTLTDVAALIDADLARFESLTAQLERGELDSQKKLERAAKALTEVAELDTRLGDHVRALLAAITAARDRQQAHAQRVHERALELQGRAQAFQALLERYGALGERAAELNGVLQAAATKKRDLSSAADTAELVATLQGLGEQLHDLATEAAALAAAAGEADFADVVSQADSLRQQLLGALNKVNLLHASLAKG